MTLSNYKKTAELIFYTKCESNVVKTLDFYFKSYLIKIKLKFIILDMDGKMVFA